jgi:hypothetical protein
MEAVDRFNAAAAVTFVKETRKASGKSMSRLMFARSRRRIPEGLELSFDIRITPTGSIKPTEVIKTLVEKFGLPAEPEAALVTPTGLFVADRAGRVHP